MSVLEIQCDRPLRFHHIRKKVNVLSQLTISFNFFMAKARTVLEAGFALNTQGSLVNGLTPLRAGVAFFTFSFRFKQPPNLKDWCFFNSDAPISISPSTTVFTCLLFKPFFSPM